MELRIRETSVRPRVRHGKEVSRSKGLQAALKSWTLALEAVLPTCRLTFEKKVHAGSLLADSSGALSPSKAGRPWPLSSGEQ